MYWEMGKEDGVLKETSQGPEPEGFGIRTKPVASKPQLSLMSPSLRSRLMAYSFLLLLTEFPEDRQLPAPKA